MQRLYARDEIAAGRFVPVSYYIKDKRDTANCGRGPKDGNRKGRKPSMMTVDERYESTARIAFGKRETGFKGGFE